MLQDSYSYSMVDAKSPNIADSIRDMWGEPNLVSYIEAILTDTTADLPRNVRAALKSLEYEHQVEFPNFPHKGHHH